MVIADLKRTVQGVLATRAGAAASSAFLLSLVLFVPLQGPPSIIGVINNFAHGPVFGLLALVVLAWLRVRLGPGAWQSYAVAFLLAALVGLAIEILQIPLQRDASLADAITDVLGAGSALCLAAFLDRTLWPPDGRSWRRRLLAVTGVLLLLILLVPVGHALLSYANRMSRFPTIMQFTSPLDMYFVELRGSEASFASMPPARPGDAGEPALRLRFVGGEWPGLSNIEPSADWTGYRRLRIDVMNPGKTVLVLGLSIRDAGRGQEYADRFNRQLAIGGGARTVFDIPLDEVASGPVGRPLDLARIAGIVLFRESPSTPGASEVLLARIWLE